MSLHVVYSASNEFMALTVRDMLRENGIAAMIHTNTVAGFNFDMHRSGGAYGEVMVNEEDVNRSQELIGAFRGTLGQLEEAEPVGEDGE